MRGTATASVNRVTMKTEFILAIRQLIKHISTPQYHSRESRNDKLCLIAGLIIACLLSLLAILLPPTTVYAHGAEIKYKTSTGIDIIATFDSGDPMAEAQVLVYSPDDPSTPWLTGTCDEKGRFSFALDASISGTWDIQVRQAGHGHMIHIEMKDNAIVSGSSSGYSIGQIIIMSGCVIWGIIGTALYFQRRRADARS